MRHSILPGLLALVLLAETAAGSIVIHVAPAPGPAPGGMPAAATLAEAVGLLAVRRAAGDARAARIVVHDGRHEIPEPVVIDAALAGEGLTIASAPGAAPVVSGGRIIEGLQADEDGTWRTVIDEVRRGAWWFEELFADLEPRTRARHPDAGFARVVEAGPDNRTSFVFDAMEIPPARLDDRAEVVFLHDWSISRVRLAAVDAAASTIRVAHPIGCRAAHYAITNFEPHPRFFVEGSPALVDAPGEWALDRESGELVYRPFPGERLGRTRLIAPVAPALVRVRGSIDAPVSNVTIRGLRFAHASWPIPGRGYAEGQASFHERRDEPDDDGTRHAVPAAIHLAWARDCRIERCAIASVGGSGVWIGAGCMSCEIVDSVVRDAGANGIMIGETAGRVVEGRPWWQSAPEQAASGNGIRHCLVERCGRRFFGAVGAWIGLAERTVIANCEIRDLPYTGVSVGWRWDETPTPCRQNLVEANHIHHVMQVLSDGGGVYTLGRQPGSVLRGNAIHDVPAHAGRAPANGIFFDQGTTDFLVEGNVFWAIATTPIRWHWTYRNTVRDNTFVLDDNQRIAHYNRAKAEDVAYEGNRTVDAATWSPDDAAAIIRAAGPRGAAADEAPD